MNVYKKEKTNTASKKLEHFIAKGAYNIVHDNPQPATHAWCVCKNKTGILNEIRFVKQNKAVPIVDREGP